MRIVVAVIFIVAAGLVFYLLTVPILDDMKAVKTEIASYDEALSNSKRIQARRDELLGTYNAIPAAELDRLAKLLPSSVSSVKFVVEVEDIVRRHGLVLRSIDIVEPKKDVKGQTLADLATPYGVVPVTVSVSGSYRAFLAFLLDVTKNLRLVDVTNLTFTASEVDVYQFSIKASTYYQK